MLKKTNIYYMYSVYIIPLSKAKLINVAENCALISEIKSNCVRSQLSIPLHNKSVTSIPFILCRAQRCVELQSILPVKYCIGPDNGERLGADVFDVGASVIGDDVGASVVVELIGSIMPYTQFF